MASRAPRAPSRKKILVLIVHGVGEQGRFDQLEGVVASLYQALNYSGRKPVIEVHYGDQAPRCAPEHALYDRAATLRWNVPGAEAVRIEAHFREVHWADLDEPMNFVGWWKFVGWALSMSGVRLFRRASVGPPSKHGMCAPKELAPWQRAGVRLKLFVLSLVFLILLGTVGLLDVVLKRLSIRIKALERGYRLFFEYLGDVKLYQDWYPRGEPRMDVVGAKSRVAIRRRMVRVLLQTATDALADPGVHGFYIFAHSLGTVVAFNALMETEAALPNYLTQAEWEALHPSLRKSVGAVPDYQEPRRRPWLDPYDGGYAAVNREALFEKCLGFVTVGSPLDRFAALWPAIVPVNGQVPGKRVQWINVHDVQDIVAGGAIRLFEPCTPAAKSIGGLVKTHDIDWADQRWFFLAHTSYWRPRKGKARFIDALYRWFEGADFKLEPGSKFRAVINRLVYAVSLLTVAIVLVWLFAALVRLFLKALRPLLEKYEVLWPLRDWLVQERILAGYGEAIVPTMLKSLLVGVVLVAVCAAGRHLWERWKFRAKL